MVVSIELVRYKRCGGGINENTNKFIFTVWFTNYVNICNAALANTEITYAIHTYVYCITHSAHIFFVHSTCVIRWKLHCSPKKIEKSASKNHCLQIEKWQAHASVVWSVSHGVHLWFIGNYPHNPKLRDRISFIVTAVGLAVAECNGFACIFRSIYSLLC